MATYGTGSAYGAGVNYSDCHVGPQKIMKIGNSSIWAGRHKDMNNLPDWSLRIRLLDSSRKLDTAEVTGDEAAKRLLPREVFEVPNPPTVNIDWPDFGVPGLNKLWWIGLVEGLRNLPENSNVGMYCEGGHGRTGTAISILAALSGNVDGDPVAWLRSRYCDEAVESWRQIDYIEEITGHEVKVKPAYALAYSGTVAGKGTVVGDNAAAATAVPYYEKVVTVLDDGTEEVEWIAADGHVGAKATVVIEPTTKKECSTCVGPAEVKMHDFQPKKITAETSVFNTNAAGDIVTANTHKALVHHINQKGGSVLRNFPEDTGKWRKRGNKRGKKWHKE